MSNFGLEHNKGQDTAPPTVWLHCTLCGLDIIKKGLHFLVFINVSRLCRGKVQAIS